MEEGIGFNKFVTKWEDLVTSGDDTRAGFVSMALEKNYLAVPYVEEAKALKTMALKVSSPSELIHLKDIRISLIAASGLSDKALNYLTDNNIDDAINGLIEQFLEPAGDSFPDELVYRYLLVKGDALGGKARNLAGTLGERKFIRAFISLLHILNIPYHWIDIEDGKWKKQLEDDSGVEKRMKGISWRYNGNNRVLLFNINVPVVKKNVDLCLLDGMFQNIILKGKDSKYSYHKRDNRFLCLGELKGGIDPAGADEHWKTANSALDRVRKAFSTINLEPSTFFIGAAIVNGMAMEIYNQLDNGVLNNAANLHNENQVTELCYWLLLF